MERRCCSYATEVLQGPSKFKWLEIYLLPVLGEAYERLVKKDKLHHNREIIFDELSI